MTSDKPLDGAHVTEEELHAGRDGLVLRPIEGVLRGIDGHDLPALVRQEAGMLAGAATQIQHSLGWSFGQHPTDQRLLLGKPLRPVDELAGEKVGARVAAWIGHLRRVAAATLHEAELQPGCFGHHAWVPGRIKDHLDFCHRLLV